MDVFRILELMWYLVLKYSFFWCYLLAQSGLLMHKLKVSQMDV